MQLNSNQLQDAKEVASHREVIRSGRILVMYKKNDPEYALFRVSTSNHLTEILTRTIARKKLLKDTCKWLAFWSKDLGQIGDAVNDFCNAIERESGLQIIK